MVPNFWRTPSTRGGGSHDTVVAENRGKNHSPVEGHYSIILRPFPPGARARGWTVPASQNATEAMLLGHFAVNRGSTAADDEGAISFSHRTTAGNIPGNEGEMSATLWPFCER